MKKLYSATLLALVTAILIACGAPGTPGQPSDTTTGRQQPSASTSTAPLAQPPASVTKKEPFKVGVVVSLTGAYGPVLTDYSDGLKAYVKTWNGRGGVKGREVALDVLDDESTVTTSVNAVRKLAGDPKVNVLALAIAGNSTMAVKPLAPELKVPLVAGGLTDAIGKPAEPYLFRIQPGTGDTMLALVKWASGQGLNRIAILSPDDVYGQSEVKLLTEYAPRYGAQIVAKETYAATDTGFSAQLVRVRDTKPELLYVSATGMGPTLIVRQFRELGIKSELALGVGAFSDSFFKAVGPEAVEGLLAATHVGALGAQAGGDGARLYSELEKALGKKPTAFHTYGWDMGILVDAATENSDGTREGIRTALDKIKDVPAINGPITFVPDNHIGQDDRGIRMARYTKGQFVPAD